LHFVKFPCKVNVTDAMIKQTASWVKFMSFYHCSLIVSVGYGMFSIYIAVFLTCLAIVFL